MHRMADASGATFVYDEDGCRPGCPCGPDRLNSMHAGEAMLQKSRFIVGLILIAVAVLILLFVDDNSYSIAGVIALAILGIVMVAISRKTPDGLV